jgi:predicted ATPase
MAADLFRQALDWARRQGALSWELRAATSLARLLRDRDRIGEARDLLAPIYDRRLSALGLAGRTFAAGRPCESALDFDLN